MNEDSAEMLEDLESCDCLSPWETDFVESLQMRLGSSHDLTTPQLDKLTEIWDQRIG